MDDFKTRLDAAINELIRMYPNQPKLRELAKSQCASKSEYENYLSQILIELPLSRRERRRIRKAERQESLKARKRK